MNSNIDLISLLRHRPQAIARIKGSADYPNLHGTATFYQTPSGVIVISRILGLPHTDEVCYQPIFAFHIHSGGSCSGNEKDPFAASMAHYNPHDCLHPYHAGDMPPLFGVNGAAFSAFLTGRFSVKDVIGRTVIIHSAPDDFSTQPSGNAGQKIACGVIEKYY